MTCEKCWSDAHLRVESGYDSVSEAYHALLDERKDEPCTPAQQCGEAHIVFDWKDGTSSCVCSRGEGS